MPLSSPVFDVARHRRMRMETRPAGEQEPTREKLDEPLREEDVTTADRLDDRVSEGEGLPDGNDQGEK